jgi:hypothetical protein
LARSFAEPENVRYNQIIEVKPTVIEGGRGSGKTMLLKSLEAMVSVYRTKRQSYREAKLDYFGIYNRLTQGFLATQEGNILDHLPVSAASRFFYTELILQLSQSLIQELINCSRADFISITAQQEKVLSKDIVGQINPESQVDLVDFQGVKKEIQHQLKLINGYVSRRIIGENVSYSGVFLDKSDLIEICNLTIKTIDDLANSTIYFLLDEYESLLPFQKVVVRTLGKWAQANCFTVKLATKKGTVQDPTTLEGQAFEEPNDYNLVDLDYDISQPEHRANYRNLLLKVCERILSNEGFRENDIRKVLQDSLPYDGLTQSVIEQEVCSMYQLQSGREWSTLSQDEKKDFFDRVEIGATYRVLRNSRKAFAGVDDFVLLSSGIMRYFLELCGMSYHFAEQNGRQVKEGQQITVNEQTDATYTLSKYHLFNIRKNIPTYGPTIYQFVVDLGDVFRYKLHKHLSEPEAARIAVSDPQFLEKSDMKELKMVLDAAIMHSVLQSPGGIGGIRPKNATEVQPVEYIICKMYAPALQFPVRSRWRTKFSCKDLNLLINPDTRQEVKTKLIKQATGRQRKFKIPKKGEQETLR